MPQGDIRAKQRRLSGHRWVSVFDFASGFYAVTVAEESRPYTCFYVEGRGYFQYKRMPFGLTGAPSTFAHMTATHLHDLLSSGVMELFVDDGGTADDDFDTKMSKLAQIFSRVRDCKLSISASKSKFFMSEAVFAGASIGPSGVRPDLSKLTAIVDWPQPPTALNLASFLGITGHFRDLIKDYARLEGPLRDLLKEVDLPPQSSKSVWRRVMQNHSLSGRWSQRHSQAFLNLKKVLTSEPVLRCPKWDGSPFIVTSDGCKDGFGAVLTQRFDTVLASGSTVTKLYPIAFASKRTSRTEEKYKPFLLEFAALKYALDQFSDIIWGYPVELETDCQALRDVINSDKLNATHARWRDGILAHHIIDARHVPGKINVVADGISREGEGLPHWPGDGSDWSVSEDWEAAHGLHHDIFLTEDDPVTEILRKLFQAEPLFLEVIDAILNLDSDKSERDRKRARHRASQYLVEDGRLWRLTGGNSTRARSKTECVTQAEAKKLAAEQHSSGGHWGRDAVKLALLDRIHSPRLDLSIVEAIKDCPQCKNFGSTHLHSLLNPITRRHPFELLVGDYLSLPVGKGGFHTLGVYLDTFSQHVWVFKYKTAGSAKTTIDSLSQIFRAFVAPETFMTDGGKHFHNTEVDAYCGTWSVAHHVVAAYSPWINGLVEGTNKLLLHVLKRLCAPNLGEDESTSADWDTLPKTWTDHLDEAVRCLNYRILPALKFTPKELLLGLVVNTPSTPLPEGTSVLKSADAVTQLAYVAQQRLDGYAAAVQHALKRKSTFDRRVLNNHPGEVIFEKGQLVQVYRSDLDYTFKTERKLLPKWSPPRRVTEHLLNSYRLETLEGIPISGEFSSRRLRLFLPCEGTLLAKEQAQLEASSDTPDEDLDDLEEATH